jgi:hypothetical protein
LDCINEWCQPCVQPCSSDPQPSTLSSRYVLSFNNYALRVAFLTERALLPAVSPCVLATWLIAHSPSLSALGSPYAVFGYYEQLDDLPNDPSHLFTDQLCDSTSLSLLTTARGPTLSEMDIDSNMSVYKRWRWAARLWSATLRQSLSFLFHSAMRISIKPT